MSKTNTKVATFNLCHSRRAQGIYSWENRVAHLVNLINRVNPAVLCAQEINQEKLNEFIDINDKYH